MHVLFLVWTMDSFASRIILRLVLGYGYNVIRNFIRHIKTINRALDVDGIRVRCFNTVLWSEDVKTVLLHLRTSRLKSSFPCRIPAAACGREQ